MSFVKVNKLDREHMGKSYFIFLQRLFRIGKEKGLRYNKLLYILALCTVLVALPKEM